MKNIIHTFKVNLTLAKMQLSKSMMYRYNFWGAFLCDTTLFIIQLLVFRVIAQNGSIGSWNVYHLTVFVGTFMALDGLYMATYFFGLIELPQKIQSGNLDLNIIKPVNTLFYTAFSSLNLGCMIQFIIGLLVVGYGAVKLNVFNIPNVIRFTSVFILMYILMFLLMLCMRCLAFWMTKVNSLGMLENTFVEFSFRLPSPAIRGGWKILLFIALPYGLMANMPSEAIFGNFSIQKWCLCFGVTVFFSLLAAILWRAGRKRYDSASS